MEELKEKIENAEMCKFVLWFSLMMTMVLSLLVGIMFGFYYATFTSANEITELSKEEMEIYSDIAGNISAAFTVSTDSYVRINSDEEFFISSVAEYGNDLSEVTSGETTYTIEADKDLVYFISGTDDFSICFVPNPSLLWLFVVISGGFFAAILGVLFADIKSEEKEDRKK